jgi:cytochrome c553
MPPLRLVVAAALGAAALSAQAADSNKTTVQNKIAQCQGCHGIPDWKTAFPEVYRVPKLGGQKANYIVAALKAYKAGERDFATMHAMASDLSDSEIQEIAKYYGEATAAPVAAAPAAAAPAPAPAAAAPAEKKK